MMPKPRHNNRSVEFVSSALTGAGVAVRAALEEEAAKECACF